MKLKMLWFAISYSITGLALTVRHILSVVRRTAARLAGWQLVIAIFFALFYDFALSSAAFDKWFNFDEDAEGWEAESATGCTFSWYAGTLQTTSTGGWRYCHYRFTPDEMIIPAGETATIRANVSYISTGNSSWQIRVHFEYRAGYTDWKENPCSSSPGTCNFAFNGSSAEFSNRRVLYVQLRNNTYNGTLRWDYAAFLNFDGSSMLPPMPDAFQPVREEQQLAEFTPEGEEGPETASYIWTTPNADVYATIPGTVTSVVADASGYGMRVELLTPWAQAVFANLATVYVSPGDEVEADCLIGTAGPNFTPIPEDPDKETKIVEYPSGYGQILYGLQDSTGYLDWRLLDYPEGNRMCGRSWRTDNCINNNPNLTNYATGWSAFPNYVTRHDSSVTLVAGDAWLGLYQDVQLGAGDYYITIVATTTIGSKATLGVQLGGVIEPGSFPENQVVISPTQPGDLQAWEVGPITPTNPLPGTSNVYRLTLSNIWKGTGSTPVQIDFVCIHTGEVVLEAARCYFPNWDFSDNAAGWGLHGGASYLSGWDLVNPLGGELQIPPEGYATHSISLTSYETEAVDYDIWVMARLELALDAPNSWLQGSATEQLEITIDRVSDPDIELADFTVNNYVVYKKYRDTFQVPADTTYTGTFTMLHAGDTRSIGIFAVCITPTEGTWPGFEDPDYKDSKAAPTEFTLACLRPPPLPNSLNPADWLNWIGQLMRYFVDCFITPILQGIYNRLAAIIQGIGWLGKYIGALFAMLVGWLYHVLSSLLRVLTYILGTLLVQWWAALVGLDLLRRLFDLLALVDLFRAWGFAVLQSFLDLLAAGIRTVGALGRVILIMWESARTALNAQDAESIGLPVCAGISDTAPLAPFCWGLSAVNYIIDQTPPLLAAGYIVAGVISWFTIHWTMNRVGKALGDN